MSSNGRQRKRIVLRDRTIGREDKYASVVMQRGGDVVSVVQGLFPCGLMWIMS